MIALWAKLKFYALAVAGAAAALFLAYWRVREDGKNEVRVEQQAAQQNLEDRYREIDGQNVSVDDAYRNLRSGGGMHDH